MVFGIKLFEDAFDTLTNKKGRDAANAAQAKAFGQAEEQLLRAQALNRLYAQQAGLQRSKGLIETRQGFDQAINTVRAGGETARVNAARLGTGAMGRTNLAIYDRGLSGTSAGSAIRSAASDRSNRFLADTEARLAELESRLQGQRGQALAGQRNTLAAGLQAAGAGEQSSANALLRLYGSRNDQAYNPLSDIVGLVQGIGSFF